MFFLFFSFNHTAPTEIYTLSLHDALPICVLRFVADGAGPTEEELRRVTSQLEALLKSSAEIKTEAMPVLVPADEDRKSTRLNSSHVSISYAVFCLKKKKKENRRSHTIT